MRAPGLRLVLDSARLSGSLEPEVSAVVRLERDGETLARTTTRARHDATFVTELRVGGGRPMTILPGDVLRVEAEDAVAAREVHLVAPRLEFQRMPDGGLAGRAPEDARLEVRAGAVYPEALVTSALARPAREPDGRWTLPPGDLSTAPGIRHTAVLGLPSGHIVEREQVVPIASIEVGGSRICGHGARGKSLRVGRAQGAASAEGRVDPATGAFRLRLREQDADTEMDAPPEAIVLGGDEVNVEGAGLDARIRVPFLSGEVDWARGEVVIESEPGAEVALLAPAGDCRGDGPWRDPGTGSPSFLGRHRVRSSGLARAEVDPALLVAALEGGGLQLVLGTPRGHRVFHALRPARAILHSETADISGTAPRGTRVSGALLGRDGGILADAITDANTGGRFFLRLADEAGETVAMQAGDGVRLRFGRSSSSEVTLAVEALTFDRDGQAGIIGIAAPERDVTLWLRLTGDRLVRLDRRADDFGRWSLEPESIPPRSGWSLADVVGLRAAVSLPEGHALVSETEGFGAWLDGHRPPPPPSLYLPRLASLP